MRATGLKQAGVGALHQADARVVAQLHGDLAEAGIDGGHMRGAVLQQAIGKSAGRGADIEAGAACNRDLPVIERRRELEPAAAHVGLVLAQQANGSIFRDRRARLVNLLLPHQNPAGKDERPGAFAAGSETPLDEQQVEP